MLRDCAIDRPSDVFLFILFQVWIVYARDERTVYVENMEESSERVVRLEQHDEITTGDDLVIHPIPQDLALAVSAIYDRMMVDVEELLFNQIRDTFLSYTSTPSYLGFVGLPDEECQQPRPALRNARRRRPPPARVSRRSSQVSPPVYLRHRFLPQSRKDSSSRRQR
ncbi:unnamed protein product [Brassica rapa subsp. trilocularis]